MNPLKTFWREHGDVVVATSLSCAAIFAFVVVVCLSVGVATWLLDLLGLAKYMKK